MVSDKSSEGEDPFADSREEELDKDKKEGEVFISESWKSAMADENAVWSMQKAP